MKTRRKNKWSRRFQGAASIERADDTLAVVRDAVNGKEYYLSVIDSFALQGRDYVVMYNYEPDDGNHADPELVIMRTEFSRSGEQYFYSIKEKVELDHAFDVFMRRFSSSSVK